MKSTNYSYETSLPPFLENQDNNKQAQCNKVASCIRRGANNLLQIAQQAHLPQSTIAARVNDLIHEGKAMYLGTVIFDNRKRKRIVLLEGNENSEVKTAGN